jgi:hypothetical protein
LRTYCVLTYDNALGDLPNRIAGQVELLSGFLEGIRADIIQATNHEEAGSLVIEELNGENDYLPTEDGGFSIVAVFDHTDCQKLADQLAENDKIIKTNQEPGQE